MDNDISENNQDNKDNYDSFYKSIISRIKQAKNNMEIIKEKAILELYWNLGETLLKMGDISEHELKTFRDDVNKQIKNDPLLCYETTNTHWLRLAKLWVKEHSSQDKEVLLSGSVTYVQWAILLDLVNSAPQRYWLACQTIKNKWDVAALLRTARSLPDEYQK
ncbi:MAG: hypothetical protein KIT56_05690 [Gammaproteobacteria bacterium]|nr:hypothetical protein [Gammaproteobacteria bacterium]MCW5583361.1 hypothetical protein [Gammaproteobacteria bacterium]